MRGSSRAAATVALALVALSVVAGAVAGAPSDDPLNNTTDTDPVTDGVADTVEETAETVDGELDAATGGTGDPLATETGDTAEDLATETSETADELTNATTTAGGSLVDGVADTLDETTDSLDTLTGATLVDGELSDDADGADESTWSDSAGDGATAAAPPVTDGSSRSEAVTAPSGDGAGGGDGDRADDPGPLAAGATAFVGVGAVAAGSMVGTGLEREVTARTAGAFDRLLRTVAPLRYSRYDGSDPLEHEDRAAIHEYVTDHSGAPRAAVSESVGVDYSTARHHIRVLEREGLLEEAKVRGRRRLFPANAQQKELAAALAEEATADVLTAISRLGPCSGSALAEEVDRSVSTVSHHLSRLEEAGLVVREKDGRATVNRLPGDVQDALAPGREPVEADEAATPAD